MARTSSEKVAELITTSRDVDLFINSANRLVTELLVGEGLSDERLADIELWISAHLVALVEEGGGILKRKTGQSSIEFNPLRTAEGLGSTRFGGMALTLDTTGTLTNLAKTKSKFTAN